MSTVLSEVTFAIVGHGVGRGNKTPSLCTVPLTGVSGNHAAGELRGFAGWSRRFSPRDVSFGICILFVSVKTVASATTGKITLETLWGRTLPWQHTSFKDAELSMGTAER